ncbi:hypothetical protein [Kribbella sp. NPDC048928]|uniref:hypothetical protein n=1 Tax=Kribbella sp. NPDC048928 TaxID=3364111 RepID=UPI0037240D67
MAVGDGRDADDRVRVRGWFLAVQALELAVAAVGLLAFGWAAAGLNYYLTTVDPRGGADSGKPVDLTWLAIVAWLLLTLVASTGLPRRSAGGGLRRARGGGGAAAVQLIGGLVVIGGTLLAYVVSHPYGFGGPDIPCTYASCWPQRPQAVGLTVPGLAAGAASVVMALLVDRCSWLTRAVVPAALWVVLLVLQNAIWDPYLLPILQGPPR